MNLNFLPVLCGVDEFEAGRVLLNQSLLLRVVKSDDEIRFETFSKYEPGWKAAGKSEIENILITFGSTARRFIVAHRPDWLP